MCLGSAHPRVLGCTCNDFIQPWVEAWLFCKVINHISYYFSFLLQGCLCVSQSRRLAVDQWKVMGHLPSPPLSPAWGDTVVLHLPESVLSTQRSSPKTKGAGQACWLAATKAATRGHQYTAALTPVLHPLARSRGAPFPPPPECVPSEAGSGSEIRVSRATGPQQLPPLCRPSTESMEPCLVPVGAASFLLSAGKARPRLSLGVLLAIPALPQGSVSTSPTPQIRPGHRTISWQWRRGPGKAGGLWGGRAQPVPVPVTGAQSVGHISKVHLGTTRWKEMLCLTEPAKSTCKWGKHRGI